MKNLFLFSALLLLLWGSSLPARAQQPAPAIRPGAPGQPSHVVDAAVTVSPPVHTAQDVAFMQGMIHHHSQALDMTALAPTRTTNRALLMLAERIEVSQGDEIAWMQRWLRERGEAVPELALHQRGTADAGQPAHGTRHEAEHDTTGEHGKTGGEHRANHETTKHDGMDHGTMNHDAMSHGGDHPLMPGMLNAEEMARLAAATGAEFDRLFLQYMIRHHEGGLLMVADLLAAQGSAQAPDVYRIATDIDADQRADIHRMLAMLDVPPLPSILRTR